MSEPSEIGLCVRLEPGLRRILAPNPSPMTFRGTNSYLVGEGELALIDPGPDLPAHRAAILSALAPGERIVCILVTHAHLDHSPLARPLARLTGAEVLAFGGAEAGRSPVMADLAASAALGGGEGVDAAFVPDRCLADTEMVRGTGWGVIEAIHTPGHFGNHLCFGWEDRCFSGDHAMGWASSLVSPPVGDMGAYMASLKRLSTWPWRVLHPGHGDPVTDPAARLEWLAAHRRQRESALLAELARNPARLPDLTAQIYHDTPPALLPAAERNLFAHLIDLCAKGLVRADPKVSRAALYRLAGSVTKF